VSLIPVINNQKAENLSLVSTTPPKICSTVSTTPAINLLPMTTMSVIRVCGVSMEASLHGSSNETIGGRVQPQ
jgi:hypothetical protein